MSSIVPKQRICGKLTSGIIHTSTAPTYNGKYRVTPSTYHTQTLATASKILTRNITIEPIPQWETSNAAGGTTLIIGEESLNGD